MNNLKGVVSVGSKFHADYTAEALYKKDMLYRFIAGKKFSNNMGFSSDSVINIALPQYLGYIQRNIPLIGSKIPYNIVSDIFFDYLASRQIEEKIDFFIGFNNFCEIQFKHYKTQGVKLFLEQRIAHVDTEIEIYLKEFGEIPQNLSKTMIERKKREYELADYILVPSSFVEESMINNGVAKEKILKIPYGYDPSIFKKDNTVYKKENGKFTAIFVGQIGYRKGIKYLLEAVKSLSDNNNSIELILVGNVDQNIKPLLKEYKAYYKQLDFIPQNELIQLYNQSDVFIFPSLCEGSARVVYEAAACGLPLVVTHNSGTFVENGKEGLIIKPFDAREIERALTLLKENRELKENMSSLALETVKGYTWANYGVKLVEAINKVLSK